MLDGEASRGAPRANVQLAVDRAQVGVDRAEAYHEPFGHLGVAEAVGDEPQHLDLTRGESFGPIRGGLRAGAASTPGA